MKDTSVHDVIYSFLNIFKKMKPEEKFLRKINELEQDCLDNSDSVYDFFDEIFEFMSEFLKIDKYLAEEKLFD